MTSRAITPDDLRFMDAALAHSYAGLGRTAPNPSVGCVIVKDGRIVGTAGTAPGGRPHAEPQALDQAGDAAQGASVYVTLEPCAHHGQTPPCAEALVAAKVCEVVIACPDPFHKVDGRGINILKDAGINVLIGVRQQHAEALNAGFFSVLSTGLPLVEADRRASLYDADFTLTAGEDRQAALRAAAGKGLTRLREV